MTHKKIAELAHVSTSTVSKALAGNPEISKELADEIRQIAIECGYFKEKSKKRVLNSSKQPIIAVLCPEIISVFYSTVITTLKNRIEEQGGHIAVYIYDFNQEKMNSIIKTLILHRDCDGIICIDSANIDCTSAIPIVCICDSEQALASNLDTIETNTSKAMSDAVAHLKELGHTKIGFVSEPLTSKRLLKFKNSMQENNLAWNDKYIYTSAGRFENTGIDAARQLLASGDMPTAIIAAYDEIAISLINELTKNSISIPDDISVVGINDIPSASYCHVPLTTLKLSMQEQYSIAVKILFNRIFNENAPVQHIKTEHRLIKRQSTAVCNR